ncbi:MAG: hypothetical protein RIB58_11240 [Phycisphaerales bacterium]
MSVKFDPDSPNDPQALEATFDSGQRLTDRPVSVSLWVRLSSAPGASEAWTIWWFGEAGAGTNDLVLEAIEPATSGVRLRATLRGNTSLAVTSADLTLDAWHCVSVVVGGQSPTTTQLLLYADDNTTPVSATSGITGLAYPDWDVFALAINRSGGALNPGRCCASRRRGLPACPTQNPKIRTPRPPSRIRTR